MLRRRLSRLLSAHSTNSSHQHHSPLQRRRRLAAEKLEQRQLLAVTVLDHYEGLSFGDSGYAPPDTSGAIGVSSYIETVNQVIRITSTDGATISTRSLTDFFFSQGNLPRADARSFLSDPVVTFHEPTQRFIIGDQDVNFDTHVSNFDLAISKSSNPRTLTTADWYFLRMSTTEAGYDADYPGNFGWNRDALVFTLNMFGVTSSNSLYTQVNAVKISDLVNGTLTSYRTRLDDFSVRPAVMHGAAAGDPMWLVSEGNDNQSLKLFKLSNVTTNFASYTTTTLRVNSYSTAKAPLQPSGQTVTTNIDSRMMNAAVRNGRLVTAHTVSTASNNDVARWYEISVTGSSPSLLQQGNVGGEANNYYTYPTIDLNEQNTMGLTFMKSGTAAGQFVSMYVTGRLAGDAAGTMQTPVLVRAGEKNQNFGRQGDLSGISVAADGTFWAANEYANSELWNWSTAIAHFRVGDSATTPGNDAFSSSSTVIGKTVRATGSNVGASKEAGEPNHAGGSGGKSIWYRWTAPSSGFVTINTQGSSFDTLLGVYTGAAVNALSSLASNDNTGTGLTSSVSFNAVANTVYRIAIDGNFAATGSVNLNIDMNSSGPVNDSFAAASALAGYTVSVTGSNMGATKELNEPNHAGLVGGRSVWWTWTAPAAGSVTLSTAGSAFNTLLAVYTGSTVASLTTIAANNDFGSATTSQLSFIAIAGTTYQIAVDGLQGAAGNIALALTLAATGPENDLFANSILITGLTATVTGNSSGGSKEPGEPNHSGRSGGSSIWYNWVAPHTGRFAFDTNGSAFDTVIGVYTGDAVNNLTIIASDDDSGMNLRSRVMFRAISGTSYRIAIDGYAGASGAVTLHVNPIAPSNDRLADALLLGEADQAATLSVGTNVAASVETGEPLHAGVVGGHSVWWRWTATEALPVIVDTVGSSFDTLLAVYQGSSITDLQPIAADNDSGGNGISRLQFTPTTGTTYFFAVDGVAGATGDILMTLQPVAEGNDNFADAQVLTGSTAAAECNSLGATRETGEPNHAGALGGKSVWYSWTAPFSGTVMMDTTGTNFDTLLAAYTGNSVDNLAVVAANDDANSRLTSNIVFNATAGVVYRIAVDGYRNAGGEVRFHLAFQQGPPPNDSFLAATTITGTTISITDSNINATRENREPLHANQLGGASVWYAWRAPETGRFSIDTLGSSFDTLLAVYTGSSLRSLRRVAANDDSGSSTTSRLTFNAKRGTTYWIAVDGYLGAQGIINLHLERALFAPQITPTKTFPGSTNFKLRSQQLQCD